MNKQELLKLIEKGESQEVEFKEKINARSEYVKLIGCSERTAFRDFEELVKEKIILRKGKENFEKSLNSQNSLRELCLKPAKNKSYSKFSKGKQTYYELA